MTSDAVPTKQSRVIAVARTAIAATAFSLAGVASAYVGPSFIQLPDTAGTWKGEPYKNWLKVDGNYWKGGPIGFGGAGGNAAAGTLPPQAGTPLTHAGMPRRGTPRRVRETTMLQAATLLQTLLRAATQPELQMPAADVEAAFSAHATGSARPDRAKAQENWSSR